ncbi:MAG: hypothetical protein ACHQNA_03385 [Acidimicrobiales bacterium]
MRRGIVASAIAFLDIVGYAVLGIVGLIGFGPGFADPVSTLMFGAAVAAFSSMGALLIRRVPANPVGALLLATGTAQTVGLGLLIYGGIGGSATPPLPGAAIVAAFGDVWYIAPFVIALVGVPLLFPDGRLPSRRFRWVVIATGAGIIATAVAALVPLIPGLTDTDPIVSLLVVFSVGAIVFGIGGAGFAVSVRFRRGDPVQRQQLKWLLAVAGVAALAFPAALILGSSEAWLALAAWAIGFLAYLAMPIAIGIAILRYRLYEIDRIISRTISYGIVTITLVVVFAGVILLFETLLAPLTGRNTVAVAGSTLVVAGLFQPLRRRVQVGVDRRFNRARYHAERTVTAFAAQLRDEVDLESLGASVLEVVAQTVAPATVGLWIRTSES